MDTWIVGQLAFWYTFHEVNPTAIVDGIIKFWLDVSTPGRGAGESNWWMRGIRTIQETAERASQEMDIRSDLRRWDRAYPEIHHELIVRSVVGLTVAGLVTSIYDSLRRGKHVHINTRSF